MIIGKASRANRRVSFSSDGRDRLHRWAAAMLSSLLALARCLFRFLFRWLFRWRWLRLHRSRQSRSVRSPQPPVRPGKRTKPIHERLRGIMNKNERIKQQTLEWVRLNLPYMRVYNYTTCWSDGLTLCFLLQSLAPQLCPNAPCLKPQNKLQNCSLALKLLRAHFQIDTETIITPEEMVAENEPEKVLDLLLAIKQSNENKMRTAFDSKRGSISSMMKRVSFALSLSLKRSNSMPGSDTTPEIADLCTARGSGLHHSIINRPSAFVVSVPEIKMQRVVVEIRSVDGDQGTHCVGRPDEVSMAAGAGSITIYSEIFDSHQARVYYLLETLCDHNIYICCNDKYLIDSPFLVKVTPPAPLRHSLPPKPANVISIEQWRIEKSQRINAFKDVKIFYGQRRSTDVDSSTADAQARNKQSKSWSVVSRRVLTRRAVKPQPRLALVAESLLGSRQTSVKSIITTPTTPTHSCSPDLSTSFKSRLSSEKDESSEKPAVVASLPIITATSLMPIAKKVKPLRDFSQQVSYEEIKKETGWSRPRGVATAITNHKVSRALQPSTVINTNGTESHADIKLCVPPSKKEEHIARHLKIFGSGLHFGAINVDNSFQVSSSKTPLQANENVISVKIDGPEPKAVKKISLSNLEADERVVLVSYQVTKVGFYSITVTYCGLPLPNSPFVCKVTE